MAYDETQDVLIARALARHGTNVAKAWAFLRENTESMRRISMGVIWRRLKNRKFKKLVDEEYVLWLAADRAGVAEATKREAERKQEGTILERLARLDSMFDATARAIEDDLNNLKDSKLTLAERIRLLQTVASIQDRQKMRLLPVIAETREAAYLVEAYTELLISKLGPARANEIIGAVGALYAEKRKAGETKAVQA